LSKPPFRFPNPPPQAAKPVKAAGRSCPLDYSYSPAVLARKPDFAAEVLYVAGGLYGNLDAIEPIERLAAAEDSHATVVFNGDFHWLDAEPAWFAAVERGVARHRLTRGNVETELGRLDDIGAGCGCGYPDSVGDDVVRRSNDMLALLRARIPAPARAHLSDLPMHLVAQVGHLRVGIVHGDAASLAGWGFSYDALDNAGFWLDDVRALSRIDAFACSHSGLAVLRDFTPRAGRITIVNNGAAGLPNFSGTHFGVVTRIATTPSPHKPLYGLRRDGVHIDALAVDYDRRAFLQRFLKRWPAGSPGHLAYYARIAAGPEHSLAQAGGP
jgi:hypothetical protein